MLPEEQLQRLYLAGFDLQTFDRFPKAIGVLRDNCIAFLVPGPEGLQILGNVGWRHGGELYANRPGGQSACRVRRIIPWRTIIHCSPQCS